jgi:high-affinity iron transporter
MFEALIVTLREGIEAALVVGLILIYLKKSGHEAASRWVYLGLAAGVAASVACGIVFAWLEVSEEAYEGWLMLAGAVCVTVMVVWMLKSAKTMKQDIEARLSVLAGESGVLAAGLFTFTFLMVLREGVETVLFLAAVNLTTDALLAFVGGVAGLLLAVLFGVAFVRGTVRIDLPRFFKVTAVVLFVLAAQLLIGGLHELGERGTIPIGSREMRLIGPIVKNEILVMVSLLALPLIFLLVPGRGERQRAAQALALEGPERRLALARIKRERSWRTAFAVVGIAIIGSLGVSWGFTRLPQTFDPPKLLGAEAGDVRIPKAGLDDGHLHRFGVPIGNTVVRFFVMKSAGKLVPAFDACAVCGAYGYIETKGRLVCLACAADINSASLQAGGGCNPIPLPFKDEPSDLVVSLADLKTQTAAFERSSASAPAPPTSE